MSSHPCTFALTNDWGQEVTQWCVYYQESNEQNSAVGRGIDLGNGKISGSTVFAHTKGAATYWTISFTVNGQMWGTNAAQEWNIVNNPTFVSLVLNGDDSNIDVSDEHGNRTTFSAYLRCPALPPGADPVR